MHKQPFTNKGRGLGTPLQAGGCQCVLARMCVCVLEVGIEGVPSVVSLINRVLCRPVCFGKCSDGIEVVFCTMAGPSPSILLHIYLNTIKYSSGIHQDVYIKYRGHIVGIVDRL